MQKPEHKCSVRLTLLEPYQRPNPAVAGDPAYGMQGLQPERMAGFAAADWHQYHELNLRKT